MDIALENKKFVTTSELIDLGCSYYKIKKLERDGVLSRITRSTYENLTYKGDENDFYIANAYIPHGVVCLMSAARHYGLTSFLPDAVDVAIERKNKVSVLPKWPSIRIFYFAASRMDAGVIEVKENGNGFHIFDIEKTVVDIVYYRNKVGMEEAAEALKNYLKSGDRNVDKLYDYAKNLRCEKIIRTYLEVLV